MNVYGAIESLLFVAGDEGLHLDEVATLMEMSLLEAHERMRHLQKKYDEEETSGITIIETRQRYQLATKPVYSELIRNYAISPFATKLSQAALETLAIIAYKQPLTRMEVDAIRGVQSSGMIQRLVIRGLIKEVGRSETPGRPILYGTTEYFLHYFGLRDMDDLPNTDGLFSLEDDAILELFGEEELFDTAQDIKMEE